MSEHIEMHRVRGRRASINHYLVGLLFTEKGTFCHRFLLAFSCSKARRTESKITQNGPEKAVLGDVVRSSHLLLVFLALPGG